LGKSFNYNKKNSVSDGGSFKKESVRNRTVEKDFVKTFRSSVECLEIDPDDLEKFLDGDE